MRALEQAIGKRSSTENPPLALHSAMTALEQAMSLRSMDQPGRFRTRRDIRRQAGPFVMAGSSALRQRSSKGPKRNANLAVVDHHRPAERQYPVHAKGCLGFGSRGPIHQEGTPRKISPSVL